MLGIAVLSGACRKGRSESIPDALSRTFRGTGASAVVLDFESGAVLAVAGPPQRGAPGSTIKPLLLRYALEHGIVRAETEVYCRRDFRVSGRALPCTHPADRTVFTAESALAESCNTWFAEMGRRFSGPALEEAVRRTHLPHEPLEGAGVEQRELAVLGLRGVTASPLELARAYREMLLRIPASGPVASGLRGSVEYGMSRAAGAPGVTILGKTGTASDRREAWTHGWFAGGIPGRLVLVVYVAHGDGGAAAGLAGRFFAAIATGMERR